MSLPQSQSTQYIIPGHNHKYGTKTVDAKTFHAWNLRKSLQWIREVRANGGPWAAKVKCEARLAKLQKLEAPNQIIRGEIQRISLFQVWCKEGAEAARVEYMTRQEVSRRVVSENNLGGKDVQI